MINGKFIEHMIYGALWCGATMIALVIVIDSLKG